MINSFRSLAILADQAAFVQKNFLFFLQKLSICTAS